MNVIKRDGRTVPFDKTKIKESVLKAFKEVDGEITQYAQHKASEIAGYIEGITEEHSGLDIEDIQNIVEEKLMASNRKDVARAYVIYRSTRSRIRERNSAWMKAIKEKLAATNVQNQNANVDEHSFGGRKGEADSELLRKIALDDLMSEMSRNNHLNNEIYIHDLNDYILGDHNCLTCPVDELLAKGFNLRQTDIRPAQSVGTAFQLLAVIFQVQSLQQFGGVSEGHIDWTMVPYVRKSFYKHYIDGIRYIELSDLYYNESTDGSHLNFLNTILNIRNQYSDDIDIQNEKYMKYSKAYQYAINMTEREIYQAVEGMYHNLNSLQSRSGNQLPFSSINYGTCTLPEGRMVTKAILDVSIKGIGKLHRTPIFPCGIFQYMKGVNDKPGTPNYDLYRLALKSTAVRLYPNYCNVDWSNNAGYDKNDPRTYMSTMGCRTVNLFDINGFGQLKDGRGNICPVTIILPTLAMEVSGEIGKKNVEEFMKLLDKKIHEAKDMLIERFEWICSQPPESAKFMYENNTMAGYVPEEGIRSALKHGTLTIGQLGIAETLQILIGCDHTTEKGMELAKRIEQLYKDRCAEFKQNLKLNFGVYYTPAESLCYTAMKKFRAKYGIIPNVSENDYFTNSMHVPVWHKLNPFEKIDIESQLTGYSSAGCITYVELDDSAKHNIDALEEIVNYAMDHDIPYFAINLPNDQCMNCGYIDEIGETCPKCGSSNIKRLRRVTGYLTNDYKTAFNKGKQQEVEMRVHHTSESKDLEG
jgi:ribonucleoside-triphosphate reductase